MVGSTDKGINGYMPTYESLARTIRPDAAICELGVYHGGSLALWQKMFPSYAVIVGVDVAHDAIWPPGTVKIVANQQDPTLPNQLLATLASEALGHIGFDLIIDDASHQGHETYKSFKHLWPLVVPGGYYVIEDWAVGFPQWTRYDDSMLAMAMGLLNELSDPRGPVHFITYQYGLIVIRKKDEAEQSVKWGEISGQAAEPGRLIIKP